MHFARITPEGRLEGDRYHIAIWTEETGWREVRVRFDPAHAFGRWSRSPRERARRWPQRPALIDAKRASPT